MAPITQILVATDFSPCSEAALAYARDLARAFSAKLHVLHTVETIVADVTGLEAYAAAIPEFQRQIEAAEREALEKTVTADDRQTLGAVAVLRTTGLPARAITDYAAAAGIDLIVLGTHGRRGIAHALLGSIAEKVVRTAPCPVLTVRERKPPAAESVPGGFDHGSQVGV